MNAKTDKGHLTTTARTREFWPFALMCSVLVGIDIESKLYHLDHAFAVGVQEAVVACASKALGQYVS